MPSIYNHENACWGIRRSSCDMFQYDLNDDFQTNKSKEAVCHSNQNNVTPDSTYVHYSVSSNGYYGYQPHKAVQVGLESSTEIEMDVEDISTIPSISQTNDSTSMFGCVAFNPDLQLNTVRRKRQMPCDSVDRSKRIRQEECGGGDGSSLRRRRLRVSKMDLNHDDYESTTTQLLRQTHGCELYLYERTCDY